MRLDKYLKSSRLIKRRVIAKELAEKGHILINGKIAKPDAEININDEVTLTLGKRVISVRVLTLDDRPVQGQTAVMFEVIS